MMVCGGRQAGARGVFGTAGDGPCSVGHWATEEVEMVTPQTTSPVESPVEQRAGPSVWSLLGRGVIGLLVVGYAVMMFVFSQGDNCGLNGIVIECVSIGGSTKVTTTYNLVIGGFAAFFGVTAVISSVLGIARLRRGETERPA